MNVKETQLCEFRDNVIVFADYEYDDALIGVTTENRAVYSFDKLVNCIITKENLSDIEAIERIECDFVNGLLQIGNKAPIIMYSHDWMGFNNGNKRI